MLQCDFQTGKVLAYLEEIRLVDENMKVKKATGVGTAEAQSWFKWLDFNCFWLIVALEYGLL